MKCVVCWLWLRREGLVEGQFQRNFFHRVTYCVSCWLLHAVVAIVTEDYNSSNVFAGDEMTMAYVVREPIVRGIFAARQTQGKAAKYENYMVE